MHRRYKIKACNSSQNQKHAKETMHERNTSNVNERNFSSKRKYVRKATGSFKLYNKEQIYE